MVLTSVYYFQAPIACKICFFTAFTVKSRKIRCRRWTIYQQTIGNLCLLSWFHQIKARTIDSTIPASVSKLFHTSDSTLFPNSVANLSYRPTRKKSRILTTRHTCTGRKIKSQSVFRGARY